MRARPEEPMPERVRDGIVLVAVHPDAADRRDRSRRRDERRIEGPVTSRKATV